MRTSNRIHLEGMEYTVYGIARTDGQDSVADISIRADFVDRILDALNRGEVPAIHFREILDNLIAQYE